MMDDLIRRVAAIDALNKACEGMHATKNYFRERAYHEVVFFLEKLPAAEAAPVVRCAECVHCCDLKDVDPMEPYSGDGDGSFYCASFDMDFYAPRYRAEAYFCADGKRREDKSE